MKLGKYHENDAIAADYVRDIFPKTWRRLTTRDIDSGREHCQDMIFEVVDELRNVTGAELVVQNKVATKVKRRKVETEIQVDCLRYLSSLGKSVILHIYSVTEQAGYWIWLDEYIAQNDARLAEKKSLTISINKNRVLDTNSVDQIAKRVTERHFALSLVKQARELSYAHLHFSFPATMDGSTVTIGVKPKHSRALDENPITFQFTTDAESAQAIAESKRTGEPVTVKGTVTHEGLPTLFNQLGVGQSDITLIPLVEDQRVRHHLSYLTKSGEVLLDIPFVELTLTSAGTARRVMEGTAPSRAARIKYIADDDHQGFRVVTEFLENSNDPKAVESFLTFVERSSETSKLIIHNLETDESVLVPISINAGNPSELLRAKLKVARAINLTNSKLGMHLPMPEKFTRQDVGNAVLLTTVLQGNDVQVSDTNLEVPRELPSSLPVPAAEIPGLLKRLNDREVPIVGIPGSANSDVNLCGTTIELGPMEFMFEDVGIENLDEINQRLKDGTDPVEVRFNVNNRHVVAHFPKWSGITWKDAALS